jgi:EmrB/QacA subfamily drug resistance transporter
MYDRRWWSLAILCMSLLVTTVDNTILNVALPSIVKDIGASGSDLQWIVDAYSLVFAGLLLTAGSLGDRLGRKGALTFGLIWFGTFSALASQAGSSSQLIICRGLMGVGGAFIFPTTLSMITNTFPDARERARAIGIWAGVAGLGVAIGPLGGGLLLEHFFWGSVFLVNVPICIAAVVLGHFLVPDSRDPEEGKLDPLGSVLSIIGLGGLLYGIIQAPELGWGDPLVITGLVVGAVFIAFFLLWERWTPDPMLNLSFFKNPRFSAASTTITLTYFGLFGSTFLLTQYFQFVLGYSPLKAGMMTAPVAIGLMVAAPRAPGFVDRYGTKKVIFTGLLVVAGCLSLYGSDTVMSSFVAGGLVRLVFGLGMGLTTAPATESIMGSLPLGKAGVGSAVNDTTRQTGGALGVAVLGSIFALRYHSIVQTDAVPASLRDGVHDSIGRAIEVAQAPGVAATDANAAINAAREAFIVSMRLSYALAAGIILLAAGVTWKYLPAWAPGATPITREDEVLAEAMSVTDA